MRCTELEQQCEKLRQSNDQLNKKENDQTQLQQLKAQLDYQIKTSQKQLDQKERETTELRELITSAKTKVVELQSTLSVIEEKFSAYNMLCTGYEQNVQVLEQLQHTLGHLESHNHITGRRRLGPTVEITPKPPYGLQNFIQDSDSSDTETRHQDCEQHLSGNTGSEYYSRTDGTLHYKQRSEPHLIEKKSSTFERTSSQPLMTVLTVNNRPRQSSVPPQVSLHATNGTNSPDNGSQMKGQQKLYNGMPYHDRNMDSESEMVNWYSSDSDINQKERDPPSSHFQMAIHETTNNHSYRKPKPLTKEKPSLTNMEVTHDLSANSSPTDVQQSQLCVVSAELQSKLQARLKKMNADS